MKRISNYLITALLLFTSCASTSTESPLNNVTILYDNDEFPWDVIKIMSWDPIQYLQTVTEGDLETINVTDSTILTKIQSILNKKHQIACSQIFDTWILLITQNTKNISDTIGIEDNGTIWHKDTVYEAPELMYFINDIISDNDSLWKKSVEGHLMETKPK